MADPSTTRPYAPSSATPSAARAPDGTSGSNMSSTVSVTPTSDDVDELGATVSGDFTAPAALRVDTPPAAGKPAASEGSVITRVIAVGTPSRSEEFLNVGAATDAALTSDSDGTSSVNSASKKMHAQTLAGLAPPPELQAAAAESRKSAPIIPAAGSKASSPSAPAKFPLPPSRPGVVPGKPGSTPPPAPSGPSRPPGAAPGFGPPPRPGPSQPPRMAFQPPPLPPAVSVPARPGTPAPAAAGSQPSNVQRPSGPMAVVTPPPPAVDPRRTNQAMPAIQAPPMPGDPRRTNQAMPAIQAPPMPGDPRRTNQAMPAIQAPPPPGDPRRSSQAMPAVTAPQGPTDPRASSQGMPAVTPPSAAPSDPRRSGAGMPAVNPSDSADVPPEAYRGISVKSGGTLPLINSGQSSSPNPPANQARVEVGFGETAPPRMIYAPGTVLAGKYRLERVLGQGGMGAVWVVRNISLDADFALKLIRRDRATEEAAARLLTEARAAAKLGHPGIVRVFDFGQTEVGDPFLVMELLTGDSFGALITRKKRLEPGVAVQMLLPVAAALAAAHGKGIVHRDLKPDNIMLATEDSSRKLVPKVLDFGIARVLRDDIERHQTMAGEVLGSPDYMSPEQARGQLDIDHRTDIWTFAVLLYESITGKRPFEGHNYNALIASIVSNPPMPIHAYGVADTELSGIIDRGLSKSPTARWQTIKDMGIALANWAVEHGIDQDISGVSIQTEWLASQKPNLKTLQPAQLRRVDIPGAEPQIAHSTAPVVARDGADWQGLRGDGRRKWIIATVVAAVSVTALIVMSKAGYIFSDSANPNTDADAGPPSPAASSSAARVTPTATTPVPPPSDTAPQPSAKASATSKTPPTATTLVPGPTTKRKAPPVPTNIKF